MQPTLTTGTTASKTFTLGTAVTKTGAGELQPLWSFLQRPATRRHTLGALVKLVALRFITSSDAAEELPLAVAAAVGFRTLLIGHTALTTSDSIQFADLGSRLSDIASRST
jgi:hypothetical protein